MKFGYLDKYDRNETPVGQFHPTVHGQRNQLYGDHRVPVNEYQALMEAKPNDDIGMTEAEREADWASFQEKLDRANLTDRELIVVNCIAIGGMSLSRTAVIVAQAEGLNRAPAKMAISRCRDKAYDKIRAAFKEDDNA